MAVDEREWAAVAVSSKRGFGPLASSATRLLDKLVYTGPGPGSYSPQDPRASHPHSSTGSAPFCTTGCGFSASAASTSPSNRSNRCSAVPGPGAHGVPQVAYTGAGLEWGSQYRPGAAAAFKAPPRSSSASAASLREQLQQQKYGDGASIPWLLAPPKHTGGRPLPGPRLVQSAHQHRPTTMQDTPLHAASKAALGASSSVHPQQGQQQLQGLNAVFSGYQAANKQPHSSSGRSSWQMRHGGAAAPGPGSYDLSKYGALRGSAQTHRSAFCRPLVLDRFGRSALQSSMRPERVPQGQQPHKPDRQCKPQADSYPQEHTASGMSAYHKVRCRSCSPPSSHQPGVRAGFRSCSPGHTEALLAAADADMAGAPGPSYYNPQQQPRKVSYRQARSAGSTFVAVV